MSTAPSSDVELFDDAAIRNPYPLYRMLRDLGPVVWLERYDVWAIPRYHDVHAVLANHRVFSSARGVAINPAVNARVVQPERVNSLISDPPLHDAIRRVSSRPLTPAALKSVQPVIADRARKLVDDLCARSSFDGMRDVAQVLPLSVVAELVGLPDHGRESMLRWASATFDAMGPANDRGAAAFAPLAELYAFCETEAIPGRLKADGWADRIYQAAAAGEMELERCPGTIREYIGPSLDTTIFATGHLLYLLGRHPEQWALLKQDPSLISAAINEALRIETPVRAFTRYVVEDTAVSDVILPEGARVCVLYGSANRDERRWEEPERFDIGRRNNAHVAFGTGIHTCAGMHLARMEITELMLALLKRVDSFEVGEPEIEMNNILRGFASFPMSLKLSS